MRKATERKIAKRRTISVAVTLILLGILIFNSLAWNYLDRFDIPLLPIGVIVGLFVLLVLFWLYIAIFVERRVGRLQGREQARQRR